MVGILDYLRSERLADRLVTSQTDTVAHRAAKLIADRYAIVASDILLFTENAEVQRWFAELSHGDKDSASISRARIAAEGFLASLWHMADATYQSVELRDTTGTVLWRATSGTNGHESIATPQANTADQSTAKPALDAVAREETPAADLTIIEPLRDLSTNRVVGSLVLTPKLNAIWSRAALGPSFGRTGYGAIIDRRGNRILAHPASSVLFRSPRLMFGAAWAADSARIVEPAGTLVYREHDSLRTASFVSLRSPPWTVLSSTAVSEFSDAFTSGRRLDIAILVLLTGAVAVAFVFFVTRATRSLEELTRAAAAVGRGDLSPPLPPAGPDEVGTLAVAFSEMTSRIGSMMREVEVSRQLAVVGEFAAQLSHEVRNPLTSLKLDLQGLQRQVRSGALPEFAAISVDASLREVNRLDSVVGGVLTLAQRPTPKRLSFCMTEVVDQALTSLNTQLCSGGIRVERRVEPPLPRLIGDPEMLSGMIMNLVINASNAQPKGGRVGVFIVPRSDHAGMTWVDLTIADDGPGIPAAKRDEVFRPFYTTRPDGTGLGLALALRTARDHGGHIVCEEPSRGFTGATFIVSLPAFPS